MQLQGITDKADHLSKAINLYSLFFPSSFISSGSYGTHVVIYIPVFAH